MPGRPRGTSRAATLARLGFSDVAAVEPVLARLGFLTGDDEPTPGLADVAASADPHLATMTLGRMLAADPALGGQLLRRDGLRRRLCAVAGASAALGDFLVSHPAAWRSLLDDDDVESRPSAYGLHRRMLVAVGADPDAGQDARAPDASTATLDALRLAYRTAQLQLAARDLTGALAVDDVAGELSDLASAGLSAGLAVARRALGPGAVVPRLAVVAMGKCGARELNYVSDVDVVFVAADDCAVDDPAGLAAATRLAEGLIRVCGEVTGEGQLFPLDAGLRPEGRDGPLVRTLASHLAYYGRWARAWEFQALLKARPVAGDPELGSRYHDATAPMVWQASARPNFVEDVQAMRRRVERSVPPAQAERQLKLGPGGLRDVEFAVQLLQLVHGRADPSLREADTLSALAALSEGGYVGRSDAAALAEAYRWLRRAEHRLQLQRLRRSHVVPTDPAARRWLARAMDYPDVAAFDADRQRRSGQVRQLHEKLFYRPLLAAAARLPTDEMRLTPQAAQGRLAALGFQATEPALRHIEALTTGLSRRAAIQRTLLPVLLGEFAGSPDPDAGLLSFRQVSDALGDTPWYLRLLRDTGVTAQRLARVLASSRYVTALLVRAPEAIALLSEDAELVPRPRAALLGELHAVTGRARVGPAADWEGTVGVARALRRHELVRLGCADLLGRLDVHAVGAALTDVAVAALDAALLIAVDKVTSERRTALPMTLAVIGLGRFGGGELGYASDADVLFVHDPLPGAAEAEAAAAAHDVAEELRRLLALPAPDPPLVVDAGLRPEGRQGPLVRSLASYRVYYQRWSAPWEAQALLRAAPAAGDAQLARRFLALADTVRYPPRLDDAAVEQMRRLKRRMEAERLRPANRWRDLKLGPGGLSDVEWCAQLLQLRHAAAVAPLRVPGTVPALRAAVEAGLLDPEDADVLIRAWTFAAAARNAVTHVTGRAGDLLPRGGRELDGVARLLGCPPGATASFAEDHRRLAERARRVVDRLFYADPTPGYRR